LVCFPLYIYNSYVAIMSLQHHRRVEKLAREEEKAEKEKKKRNQD
jgi:hypothetical protein